VIENDSKQQQKSNFEKLQEKRAEQIADLETQIVEPRNWAHMGEISASQRPADSLVESHLEFDFVSRLPPPVTEDTTINLESIIKARSTLCAGCGEV